MAFTNTTQQQVVPLFNGENYGYWCIKMKDVLCASSLWEVVENGIPEVESDATNTIDWPKKDAEALAKIHIATTDTVFPRIMNAVSAKEAWDILKTEFEGTEK